MSDSTIIDKSYLHLKSKVKYIALLEAKNTNPTDFEKYIIYIKSCNTDLDKIIKVLNLIIELISDLCPHEFIFCVKNQVNHLCKDKLITTNKLVNNTEIGLSKDWKIYSSVNSIDLFHAIDCTNSENNQYVTIYLSNLVKKDLMYIVSSIRYLNLKIAKEAYKSLFQAIDVINALQSIGDIELYARESNEFYEKFKLFEE